MRLEVGERDDLLRCLDGIEAAEERMTHTLLLVGARAGRDGLGGWTAGQLDDLLRAVRSLRRAVIRAPLSGG